MSEKIAVYPGTFDPMTKGHFDLIVRAAQLFDKIIVAVAATSTKKYALFPAEERMEMIREDAAAAGLKNVEVKKLEGLLVDFCRAEGARIVLRGVRAYSDFEYESQLAFTNRRLSGELETLFLMPSAQLAYVTASTVRELVSFGGDTAPFVTPAVERRLQVKRQERKGAQQ